MLACLGEWFASLPLRIDTYRAFPLKRADSWEDRSIERPRPWEELSTTDRTFTRVGISYQGKHNSTANTAATHDTDYWQQQNFPSPSSATQKARDIVKTTWVEKPPRNPEAAGPVRRWHRHRVGQKTTTQQRNPLSRT